METTERDGDAPARWYPLPEYADWMAAVAIALGGIAFAAIGAVLSATVDRELLAEGIESGAVTVDIGRELTQAESISLVVEVAFWSGIGLAVTGIGLVLFAAGYAVSRHRTHQRTPAGESAGSYRAYAVMGAVVTTVFSFIPFSHVLGGGVAGYLEHHGTGRETSVGAFSGLLSVAPALSVLVFVAVGVANGFAAAGVDELVVPGLAVMVLVALFSVAYAVGVSAVGGFVGGRIADE